MHPLLKRLLPDAPILTDGAWGTALQTRGLPRGACADAWNLTRPDLVEQLARDYVAAGSRILLTNTFRANRLGLADFGLADQVVAINRAGATAARRAAEGRAYVFGSIGPSAASCTREELAAAFTEQADVLARAEVDGLVLETMTDLNEARLALAAAQRTGLPVVVSMVYLKGTLGGKSPAEAAAILAAEGADVLGLNCGSCDELAAACQQLRQTTHLPLWLKPNAGLPAVAAGRLLYPISAEAFTAQALPLIAAGATFLGGCCGTTPEYISHLRQLKTARSSDTR